MIKVMGELIRFPLERRSQQQPCVSLLRQAKVLPLHRHEVRLGGLTVDFTRESNALMTAFGAFTFGGGLVSYGQGSWNPAIDAKPTGDFPSTG